MKKVQTTFFIPKRNKHLDVMGTDPAVPGEQAQQADSLFITPWPPLRQTKYMYSLEYEENI